MGSMEIVIVRDADAVGQVCADLIRGVVKVNARAVLGLATGSSPATTYRALAGMVGQGELDLSTVSGFALDEYVGVPADHPASYASVIRTEVVEPLRMDPSLVRVPDGRSADLKNASALYEQQIADAGGVDLQILGIGRNGHIGFNEPTSSFGSRTRIKTLTEATRRDNARFFASPSEVPTHCLTQGLGTIGDARHVVLVAHGEEKAAAIAAAVEGALTSMVPASALQLFPNATVIVDEAAAALLTLTEYYRYAYANKPLEAPAVQSFDRRDEA